jgi:hypothetical protein
MHDRCIGSQPGVDRGGFISGGVVQSLADRNRTLPIANRAGGISRACGKSENGRSAGIGDEESAIMIC